MSFDLREADNGNASIINIDDLPRIDAEFEIIVSQPAEVAESPIWHNNDLWWCDIPVGVIKRLTPEIERTKGRTAAEVVAQSEEPVSAIRPTRGGGLVVANGEQLRHLPPSTSWPGYFLGEPEPKGVRFNDMNISPEGDIWVGRVGNTSEPSGELFRASPTSKGVDFALEVTKIGLPNGIGWREHDGALLFIDSLRRSIYLCGQELNRVNRVWSWVQFQSKDDALPDGWCEDSEGCWWVAMWGGGCLVRIDPFGQPVGRLDLPVKYPTSVAFGPKESRTLWITTEGAQANDPAVIRANVAVAGKQLHVANLQ